MGVWTVGGRTVCGWGAGAGGLCPVMGDGDRRTVGGGGAATAVARGGAWGWGRIPIGHGRRESVV